jgi:tetratricopeptide (TPR) repeat protein
MKTLRIGQVVLAIVLATATLGIFAGGAFAEQAADAAAEKQIEQLVKQLGADEYAQREDAQKKLAKIGQAAFDALYDAQESDDVETSLRSKYLLRLIRFTWIREGDSEMVKVILKDYDAVNEQLRYYKMRELAELANAAGVEALCRLARFEKSNKRSKYAALRIVRMESKDEAPLTKERGERILKSLGRSRRDAAGWLRAYVTTASKPDDAAKQWGELVAKEQKTLDLFPAQTDRTLVATMMQYQVDLLERLDREKESLAVLRKMFDYVDVDRKDTLLAMVNWLARKRAWTVIDEVSKRFEKAFASNALLLYTLAQARLSQDAPKEAEKLADQAIKLQPGKTENAIRYHMIIANELQERDLLLWAEREFRHVIKTAEKKNLLAVMARSELSYMLHDLERHKEAADMLGELVKLMGTDRNVRKTVASIYTRPEALKARMNFYYSKQHALDGDRTKQRAALDEALKNDATDGDVLIDLYKLSKQDPEQHKKTMQQIKAAVAIMRVKMRADPESATWLNQFAWLVANTEGDKEEALKFSLKSVKMRPDSGGLLDTLAHCYFALEQFDKAVATQQRAVQLEPSSRTIRKKLKEFIAARDAAKKES